MKKIFIILAITIASFGYAQEEEKTNEQETQTTEKKEKSEFWKKVRFGGGAGLNFWNNSTSLTLTPTAIYNFNEKFSAGAGVGYRYTKFNDVKNNVYSMNTLALFNPIPQLQLSSEFEQLFVSQKIVGYDSYSYNYPALYLGIAYTIGRFSAIGFTYDVLFDSNKSIYGSPINPIIRVFF